MEIKGQYYKTFFRNSTNGYTLFSFITEKDGIIKCAGRIPKYTEKAPLLLIGHMEKQLKNNREEEIFFVESLMPYFNNKKMLKQYVVSNLSVGLGTVAAEKILQLCDYNLDNLIYDDKAIYRLCSIHGMTEQKAAMFLNRISNTTVLFDIYDLLFPYGGTYKDADNIYKKYGTDSLNILREKPFMVGRATNVTFGVIDRYAKNNGAFFMNENRVIWIIQLAAQFIPTTGSTYASKSDILKFCRKMEKQYGAFDEEIPYSVYLLNFLKTGYITLEKENDQFIFFPSYLREAEISISNHIERNKKASKEFISKERIQSIMGKEKILDKEQTLCFQIFEKTGIKFIIGGPGSGKTTTIKRLIEVLKSEKPDVLYSLCAPTGRAAERITEATGIPAQTIHMLLEYKSLYGEKGGPTRNVDNRLDADVILIDEFSMVDTKLFEEFLTATKDDSLIILVGDEHQLKSVNAGKVMQDMLDSKKFDVYKLETNHRQGDGSVIVENANKIRNMQCDLITDDSFQIFRAANPKELKNEYLRLMKLHYKPEDVMHMQALGIMKNNECGVNQLNECAQMLFSNPIYPKFYSGKEEYYVGDKIMTLKNDYDKGYMNGDIGYLQDFSEEDIWMLCGDHQFIIPMENAEDISLAYCITVHKSQGSESDIAILVIPYDVPESLLDNSLIYVGATRARKKVYILSEMDALEKGIKNKRASMRKTKLKERILGKI